MSSKQILFLGDCNTLGTPEIEGQAYPELVAQKVQHEAFNCGHTMSTVREGQHYFKHFFKQEIDIVCLQYGLVDSWLTFKYSPYVLYYPDNRWRKLGRKLTKKFKKWCRRLGLNELIGTRNVVPESEYTSRIEAMIEQAAPRPFVLIETVPNKDTGRNPAIKHYNQKLAELAESHENCSVLRIYDDFESTMREAYCDPTHLSVEGHAYLAKKLEDHLKEHIL